MRTLVTGATGKVGHATARTLLAEGHDVRALVRDPERAAKVVPEGAELMRGDVTDSASVARAAVGREVVFNAMGLPEQWLADPAAFQRVNVEGTRAVVEAARAGGTARLVHTSTIDVFHAEPGGSFDESVVADYPKGTAYERSKQEAERVALAGADGGLEVVVVNPAAVYGPGPAGSASVEHDVIRRPPLLPRGQLHFFLWNAAPRANKAQRELGWRPTELRDGVRRTLEAHGMLEG